MSRLATWGNELYAGKKSYPFVQRWKTWFIVALVLLLLRRDNCSTWRIQSRHRFSWFRIYCLGSRKFDPAIGERVVADLVPDGDAMVTNIASGTIRVQTAELSDEQTLK